MKKFLGKSILDELYEAKGDVFADNILEELGSQKKELKSLLAEENLVNKIKESIKDETLKDEILKLLNKYELETGNEKEFWNKMYYKLGFYNCVEIKQIMQIKSEENNTEETKTTFFDESQDDFEDYLNSNRVKLSRKNVDYKQYEEEKLKIKEDNPNVTDFLENEEIKQLTGEELQAVLDILELQENMDIIETMEVFKLGAREMLLFLKQMKILN